MQKGYNTLLLSAQDMRLTIIVSLKEVIKAKEIETSMKQLQTGSSRGFWYWWNANEWEATKKTPLKKKKRFAFNFRQTIFHPYKIFVEEQARSHLMIRRTLLAPLQLFFASCSRRNFQNWSVICFFYCYYELLSLLRPILWYSSLHFYVTKIQMKFYYPSLRCSHFTRWRQTAMCQSRRNNKRGSALVQVHTLLRNKLSGTLQWRKCVLFDVLVVL